MKNTLLLSSAGKAPEGQIRFIASDNFSNVNFFKNITDANSGYDFSNLKVYINGELTSQLANSISASADDDVIIKATSGKYPWFDANGLIKSVEEPFPLMHQTNGNPITSLSYCLSGCGLTSIPQGLFDNNPQVTDFSYCFNYCYNLTSIPQGLFDKHAQATDFSGCFYDCFSLTSIPLGLFDKNTRASEFSDCFNTCYNLVVNVQIGSTASSVYVDYFDSSTKEKGTVYCRAGSAAYNAFAGSSNTNVNVLTY